MQAPGGVQPTSPMVSGPFRSNISTLSRPIRWPPVHTMAYGRQHRYGEGRGNGRAGAAIMAPGEEGGRTRGEGSPREDDNGRLGRTVEGAGMTGEAGGDPATLGALFDAHVRAEFVDRDVEATMATMTERPYVNHVPVMTGGFGRE